MSKQHGVFTTLLLSYAIILLLLTIIGSSIFAKVTSAMIENAHISNSTHLEQVKQDIDGVLSELWQLTESIATNAKVNSILYQTNAVNEYTYHLISKELAKLDLSGRIIDSYYIYFATHDKVVSSQIATDSDMFFNHILQYKQFTYGELMNQYFDGFRPSVYFPAQIINEGAGREVVTFVQSLPLGEKSNVSAYLFIPIDAEQLKAAIAKWGQLNQGHFFIVNDDGQVVTGTTDNRDMVAGLNIGNSTNEGSLRYEYEGENMLVSVASSERTGWKYVSIMPEKVIMTKVNDIQAWIIMMFFVFLVAGILVYYFMAYKNISPIRDVVRTIKNSREMSDQKAKKNEFELIDKTINELFTIEKNLTKAVLEQLPIVRSNFLNRLIKGRVDLSGLDEESLIQLGLTFPFKHFIVIIIDVDDCEGFIIHDTERERTLVRLVIINIMDEMFIGRGYTIEQDQERLFALINIENDSIECYSETMQTLQKIMDIMQSRFRTLITMGVSSAYHGMGNIGKCYEEASVAIDYKVIKGYHQLLIYDEMKVMDQGFYHYPLETEQKLLNYVKSGDINAVEEILDQLYAENLKIHELSPEMGKCFNMDIFSTLIKASHLLDIRQLSEIESNMKLVKSINNNEPLDQIQIKMKSIYQVICELVKQKRTTHHDRLYAGIVHFVNQYYHDSNLSLEMIADQHNLSAKYISSFFKMICGKNLSDFVTEVRIKHAKGMLADPHKTISSIAQAVGYAKDASFIRVFKKAEGVTPGAYRKLIKK